MTTLLSKAEEATAETPVSEEEIADLEKQVSEQGTVVSQVKEVRPHSSALICVLHDQYHLLETIQLSTWNHARAPINRVAYSLSICGCIGRLVPLPEVATELWVGNKRYRVTL